MSAEVLLSEMGLAVEEAMHYFLDRCELREPGTSTPDGFGGTTEADDTILESDIEVYCEPLTRKMLEFGGARITTQTHRLTMRATENTRAIQPHQQIVVAARDVAERTFLSPVTMDDSYSPLVMVAAEIVK
jgi:hypothetical protein